MPKVLLNNLSSLANETSAIALINANNDAIEEGFNNTISRNGLSPNTWEADLDINNNHIINLAEPTDNSHAATKYYVDNNEGPAGPQGPTGPQGETGPQGDQGDAVIWIVDAGAPSDIDDGEDGDMYLDSSTGDVYGPKDSGAWGSSIANLQGPQGDQGPAGSGDLSGPGTTVTDDNIVTWDGTDGSTVQDSGVAIADVVVDADIANMLETTDIGVSVQAYDAQLDTWSTVTPSANGQSLVSAANYAAMRTLLDLEAGTDFYSIAAADAAFEPIDADILKADTPDTLTAGFAHTVDNDGTQSSGTYTPDQDGGNMKRIVNGGAFTLAPPTDDCCIILQITNNASAGAITTSGFTGVFGDAFTTTNGDDFICTIIKINGFSSLTVQDVS